MFKIKHMFALILFCVFSLNTYAGNGSGKVEIEHVGNWNSKEIVFFYTTAHTNVPICNTYKNRWALDISTNLGRSQYSLLLASQAGNKEVVVGGSSDCLLYENSETVHWVGYPVNYSNHP